MATKLENKTTVTEMPRVDIIIPAYNAHGTILRTLTSIANQNILQDLDVTIVNDGGEKDYSEFVNMFAPYYSIREIKMEVNGGPGDARQYGIDNTKNPLLTFIDADDTFNGPFVLKELRRQLVSDPKSHMCVGGFIEEHTEPKVLYIPHQNDLVWMFGKMYSRWFLQKYNIRFNPEASRANEDTGFNKLIQLCSGPEEQIKFIADIIYNWHERDNSITRNNNYEYAFNQSFVGFTDNMIYAIKEAKKRFPFKSEINYFVVETLCNLYEYYVECVAKDPRFQEQNFNMCKKFYNECFKEIESQVNLDMLKANYFMVMKNAYMGDKLMGIIPHMDIFEFIEQLKKGDKDNCVGLRTLEKVKAL